MTDRRFSNRYVELLEEKEEQPHQQQNASVLLPILTGGQVLRPYFNSVRVGSVEGGMVFQRASAMTEKS